MDLLSQYNSDSSSSENERLGVREIRQVYLVTYSQVDTTKFPCRQSFAEAVVQSFSTRKASVVQWCCSKETHRRTSGIHYHVAIKLDRIQRWLPSKRILQEQHGISVHFSSVHVNYYSAWKYVTKEDTAYEQSEGHPDLTGSHAAPTTMRAHEALGERRQERLRSQRAVEEQPDDEAASGDVSESPSVESCPTPVRGKKRKRLSAFDVSNVIVEKNLRDRTALLAFANVQKREGKTDLAEFLINRGTKVTNELITNAWEMEQAEAVQRRKEKSRLDLLGEARDDQCLCTEEGQWETCALEILANNNIPPQLFRECVIQLLVNGRGKYRNVMLTGPANCGKTFLLDPLNSIYYTFTNPASTSFAWVGAEKAEVIFLNDFRWGPQVIAWHDFLLMLEGQVVHLPAPKSYFANDIMFDGDTPIFCTTKRPLVFIKNGCVDDRETEMMEVRWKIFNLTYQIHADEQLQVQPCSSCFARLILNSDCS